MTSYSICPLERREILRLHKNAVSDRTDDWSDTIYNHVSYWSDSPGHGYPWASIYIVIWMYHTLKHQQQQQDSEREQQPRGGCFQEISPQHNGKQLDVRSRPAYLEQN